MTMHPQARAVVEGNDWTGVDPDTIGIARLRTMMNARLVELAGAGPALEIVRDLSIDSGGAAIPIRLYRPRPMGTPLPAYVYFHSGGYCVYDIDTADAQCRAIAQAADCAVVSVGYRLAPEAPFPAAVDDAWAAVCWVATGPKDIDVDPTRIAVGGESCGGTLATVCTMLARQRGAPALCGAVLSCALLEIGAANEGETRTLATWMRDRYIATPGAERDYRASPLRHPDLSGLPPHLLITGEYDGLRDQAYRYAARLKEAGTACDLHDFPGMIHNFTGMRAALDDAQRGLDLVAEALNTYFSAVPDAA